MTGTHFIFDFDGVLFDTARECLSLAFEAVVANTARWKFATKWQGMETPPADVEEVFLRQRYWVGPPWQYSVLLKVIADGSLPASTPEFMALCERLKPEHEDFTVEYFAARQRQAAEPVKWLRNMRAVVKSCDIFRSLGESTWILSTRDGESICRIHTALLGSEFPAERVLPRAGAKEKWELLQDFSKSREIEPESVFFLDDYVAHALPAKQRGFNSYLAGWGYLGPDDLNEAKSNGLPVLALDDLKTAVATHRASFKS
jgi:phosphoglycolate phosphatase-like HAD superfamily hydrolase